MICSSAALPLSLAVKASHGGEMYMYCNLQNSSVSCYISQVCGIECHKCDIDDANCGTFPSGSTFDSEVCNSCWTWAERANDEIVTVGRGCSNLTCANDYPGGYCPTRGETLEVITSITHSTKKPVTTMLTYPWKCTVLHCNHLGNTWKPLVLMT